MSLEPGAKFGPYEILTPLPGTADAYKASDTERQRTVSLRFLRGNAAAATERLEREARTLSALNHPGIAAVYNIERHEDSSVLVSEYVEGETLAECLARGPMELDAALKVAIDLADALNRAHRKDLVHRNLCPSNVVLTDKGARLIDFGIRDAAVVAGGAISASMAPTSSVPLAATAAPTSSMPYRSPEELEGKDPDARSDIFAFGAILYEMVTGKPAFEGKTQALVIAAISSIDPEPLSKVMPEAPAALDFVVQQCLVKSPAKRLQAAWDLLSQLQWIAGSGGEDGITAAAPRKKRERWIRVALVAAGLLAFGLAPLAYFYYTSSPARQAARFVVSDVGFMFPAGGSVPSVSPDGRWLASGRSGTDPGLDVIALDTVTKQTFLRGTLTYFTFWSPDSKEIGFFDGGQLKKVNASGGQAQIITEAPTPYAGATWSQDGVIVFSSGGLLYRVRDVGGERVQIYKLDASRQETEHVAPHFLPDGRHFLYRAVSSDSATTAVFAGSVDSEDPKFLFNSETRVIYAAPGYVFFNRGDVVFAQAFDADKLELKGEPVRIADGVAPAPAGNPGGEVPIRPSLMQAAMFDVSQTGVLAYRVGTRGRGASPPAAGGGLPLSLVWIDRTGTNRATVGPPGAYAGVDLAPDGKRFAVHRHEGDGGDIWVYDPDQGDRLQRWTTNVSQENSSPVWSPDGKRIAFASRRNGKWGIYIKSADNTGAEDLVVESELPKAPMSWPSTEQLIYWVEDPRTRGDIWAVSTASGERKPTAIVNSDAEELFPQVSADGKWIAYQAPDAMGTPQIWVNSFPKGQGAAWQITNDGGQRPRWRRDGKELELYFYTIPTVRSVTLKVVGSAIQVVGVPKVLWATGNPQLVASSHYSPAASYLRYAVSPDGQRFLFPQPADMVPNRGTAAPTRGMLADSLILTVDTRGAPGTTAQNNPIPNEIAIVLDWPRLLKQN